MKYLKYSLLAPLIDSANATPADWDRIAATIAARASALNGVVAL